MRLKKKLLIFILGIILVLGFFLRSYKLGDIPGSLNWDEVSWGYSAYSILTTGEDEYGRFMPTSFEALGDFKQPFYVYSELIPIKIFGLTPFSTRFPSAFFGTLSVLFVYFLVKDFFRNTGKEKRFGKLDPEILAVFSAFFFAVSPWSIQFSRVAYEANTALFFIISGIWAFVKGFEGAKWKWFFLGTFLISISSYTYHSSKVFVPLFFAFLLIYAFFLKRIPKKILFALLLFFVSINSIWLLDSRTTQRGRSVLFVSNQYLMEIPAREAVYDLNNNYPGTFFHKRPIVFFNKYVENYLSHFNPVWLFSRGDQERHHPPETGLLYPINLPFILLGVFFLLYRFKRKYLIMFTWLLMAPVASALAIDSPNASRSMLMLPVLEILAAIGLLFFLENILSIKHRFLGIQIKYFIPIIPLLFFIFYFSYFLHQYYVHTRSEGQISWQYGYKEAIEWASNVPKEKKVVFSKDFEKPYIFFLFYMKYDPGKYITEEISKKVTDKEKCFNIENNYFGNCKSKLRPNDIYIALNSEEYDKGTLLKTFSYANGPPAIRIYESH